MLEQEKPATPEEMTQLEGIRQKVFMDRYSLKDANGQPLEFSPEQLWARVARGIAAVEKTQELQANWEKRFYEALSGFQFVPGGRILAGAGSGHQVTFYNCMPPDQEVLTADGYRPISEIKIGDLVVTHRNRLRPVVHKFERETEETLYIIRPKKVGYDDLRVTGDHKIYLIRSEWVNKHKSRDGLHLQHEPDWIPAKEIKPGDYVAVAFNDEECPPEVIFLQDHIPQYETKDGKLFKATTRGYHGHVSDWGTHYKIQDRLVLDGELCYLFGRWLGDGCVTHRTGTDIPSGIKIVFSLDEKNEVKEIARIIEAKFGIEASIKLSSTERWYDLWVNSMPIGEFFKAFLGCYSYDKRLPDQLMHLPAELTLELLRGLFSADGYLSDNKLGIALSNRTLAVQIHQLLLRMGYLFSIRENTHRLGRVPAYRVQATANECAPLFERFFGIQAPEHSVDLKYYFEYDNLKWVRVDEIAVEDYSGIVLDIEVEEDHSFISAGIVVSNCYVIPSPEDSRQGILDNLKTMTEIMARGGGVGINLSTLRPRGSYIKTVNGTASGPCSWAQLYSVATGDVIQQGGCFGPEERIATDRGLLRAKELADRLDNGEPIQAQTHKGLRPFTAVFRNGIKDLYEVMTSRGYQVRVTLDHKMGVLRNGEVVTIPLRELEEGDEILLLLGEKVEDNSSLMPLSASPYNRSKMSTTLNEQVTLPTHLTPELAYLLGFFYGDGYVIHGKKVTWRDDKAISFAIENTRPDIRDRLVSLVRELFSIEPVVGAGGGACTNVKVYSRVLIEWLEENGLLKEKAQAVHVPETIFRSPSTVVGAFIAGYFDADGSDRGRKGGYGFDSVSREMLEDIQLLLIANGIVSHITTQDRSKNGWLPFHRLIVTGAQFKERFSKFVLGNKDKQRPGYRSHRLSYPMEVWDTLGIPGRYYQGLFDSTKERVSHYALMRVRERVLTAGGVAMVERLETLLGVLPDAIISITPLGPSEAYDFEVDDVHLLSGGGIYTSNSRRGALMLMLDDNHPDIEEFITVKRTEGKIEHANLSVCISDKFMQAVKDDADWDLTWQGEVKKTIRARDLWDLICTSAWESAEPGVVFMDRYNKLSNTWYYEDIRCVNPCGEQGLPPWGVCNLGALNLSAFVVDGEMDWQRLAGISKVAMRFLDNVVDANDYFIEENREAQLSTRRTGLGTMGLADALIKMQIPYGSDESVPMIERIYTTIRDAAYEASADIAAEKGPFPKFDRDKYMQGQFIKRLPKAIQEKIKKQGIRNAVLLTQAPTGTTSLFAGVSSGIEPVYDFAMVRRDRTGEHILYHPLLQAWRDEHPDEPTPSYFVAANDLTPEEHVRVQATIQSYTDSSISKTVNAPNSHTVEDVQKLYRLAYELGCKGITYMRDGSRVGVLSHIEEKKPEQQVPTMEPVTFIQQGIKPRPAVVQGYTRQVSAPEGKVNVTINSDEHGPLEVFVNVGKAGSDIAALAEALGRLISLNLRVLSPLSQTDRAKEIAEQLRGIGGSRSVGFGMQQVRSLPDAVARALEMHIESLEKQEAQKQSAESPHNASGRDVVNGASLVTNAVTATASPLSLSHLSVTGNLCPRCGCNTMVYEEGCRKCYSCGHSEC
jgi:ribonucleotide reductase alpha subunit/intein/homing endonuclease